MERRYKIKVNSTDNIEVLLQETYDETCRHINEIQIEMNKLNSTNLSEASIDERTKFAKAMHEFIVDKKAAITMKLEIAKLLNEIVKHNGSVEAALADNKFGKATKLDLGKLRGAIGTTTTEETDRYTLKP